MDNAALLAYLRKVAQPWQETAQAVMRDPVRALLPNPVEQMRQSAGQLHQALYGQPKPDYGRALIAALQGGASVGMVGGGGPKPMGPRIPPNIMQAIDDMVAANADEMALGYAESPLSKGEALRLLAQDMDEGIGRAGEFSPAEKAAVNQTLIDLGVYRETTPQEMASMVTTRRGKPKPDLRFKGKMYLFNSWEPVKQLDEGR